MVVAVPHSPLVTLRLRLQVLPREIEYRLRGRLLLLLRRGRGGNIPAKPALMLLLLLPLLEVDLVIHCSE